MTVNERRVAAPTTRVSAVLADPTTYPAWLVGAKRIRHVDDAWPAPGASFEHEVGAGPLEVHDRTEVREWRSGRELRLLVRARPVLVADVRFEIEPADGGTLIRMTETPCGTYKLLSWAISPLVHARNGRSLDRLAELVERAS